MPIRRNKMDHRSDAQLLIMQATNEANKQDSDEKIKNFKEDLIEIITSVIYKIKPPQLDSMWTWSYIHYFKWYNNYNI